MRKKHDLCIFIQRYLRFFSALGEKEALYRTIYCH
jgi:hypothetical protein